MAVKVSAANTAITGAKRVVTFTVDGYTGTEVLTNVPVLVRLSTAIEGFSYADFADANGGDMVFCDDGESANPPPYRCRARMFSARVAHGFSVEG